MIFGAPFQIRCVFAPPFVVRRKQTEISQPDQRHAGSWRHSGVAVQPAFRANVGTYAPGTTLNAVQINIAFTPIMR